VKFTLALAMTAPERIVPLAQAAQEAGWDAVCFPDSVFYPETVSGEYPFSADGSRFWRPDTPFVDPFVAMAAAAASTSTLRFYTNVLKTPLRHPLLVAKSLGSLAAMFPGRIGVGVGLSWMPEEYEWLAQEMSNRGRRLDEQIHILRMVTAGGFVEHHGQHYDFGRLRMDPPAPSAHPIPIYVGGHSDAGLARAVRLGDGWIGAQSSSEDLLDLIARLRRELDLAQRDSTDFEIKATPLVAATPEAMAPLAQAGLTDVITVPWYFSGGDPNDHRHQLDSISWFGETVIQPMHKMDR